MLTGGPDLDPALYHEAPAGAVDLDPARDALDRLAWAEAERRAIPVFGICRGLQAINVFSGGSLVQDVPSHAGTPYGAGPAKTHDMEIDPDSRLARALAAGDSEGLAATDEDDETVDARDAFPFKANVLDHGLQFVSPFHRPLRPGSSADSVFSSCFVSSFHRKYPSPSPFSSSLYLACTVFTRSPSR